MMISMNFINLINPDHFDWRINVSSLHCKENGRRRQPTASHVHTMRPIFIRSVSFIIGLPKNIYESFLHKIYNWFIRNEQETLHCF